jgi:PAS domain S-box-containing protein
MQTENPSLPTKRRRAAPGRLTGEGGLVPEVFQTIAQSVNDAIVIFNQEHQILFANRVASEITGYAEAELQRMSLLSLLGNPKQFLVQDPFVYPEGPGAKGHRSLELLTAGGEIKQAQVFISPFHRTGHEPIAYAIFRDLTEPRRLESKIEEAVHQFEKIAEMADDGILVFDQAFQIVFANRMASELFGIPKEELMGRNFFSSLGSPDQEFFERSAIRGEGLSEKLCTEMTIRSPQGEVRDVEVYIAPAKSETGEVKAYAFIRDITARKQFQRDLKESEQKLRTLFERVRHGVFTSSKEGKFLDCNPALLEMLGYATKEEFLLIDIATDLYVLPQDRKAFQDRIEEYGYVKDMEVEFKKKTGEKITVLQTGHGIKDSKGEIIGYQGMHLDISERKRIENELRDANEFFTNLIESSVDGIMAADRKGNIFIFNKGAETLTGYKAEEVIGKIHIANFYPEGMAKEIMSKLRSLEYGGAGKLTPTQITVFNKAGEELPIQISASLIYNSNGNEVASVGIFTDLRPRLSMEKKLKATYVQLVNSEKLASLGKLAAGIAHEINNPLGGVLIYTSLMMEDLPEDDPKRQDLARIVQETGRCKEIVKSLLEFAHQSEPKIARTDINRTITEGLFFLENQAIFHNVRIVKTLDPSVPFVQGDASQLKQVFTNIMVNAAEAIHGAGTLMIRTFHIPGRKKVFVEFTDNGEGIPKENLGRIFDPFFTTKDVGKGTGMGLATCYSIVDRHGGKISVRSRVGEGTTFTIELHPYPETHAHG